MKRILFLCSACLFSGLPGLRGEDSGGAAAVAARQEAEENYKGLKGHVEDLLAAQAEQEKHLAALAREISELREQVSKPAGNYAGAEDLKRLAETIQEIDKKRQADKELILEQFAKLERIVTAAPTRAPVKPSATEVVPAAGPKPDETGYNYVIKKGDRLALIAKAYQNAGVKVTAERIQQANPGLDPARLIVGKKIFIPAGTESPRNGTH
jgi:LysM repeat protein